MAAPSVVLRLEGLSKRYSSGRGVGPITLDLPVGIHGLLGPNGSGKTTLLKTLLGFLAPSGGRASVLGYDSRSQPLEVRRRVGYMAENDVFVPGLNAVQTVRLAAELCGLPPARAHEAAAEALQAVGLGEESLHAPNRLSTGQRQKMKLASALVHAPRLLFLDEPTNGLDPSGRRVMLQLIQEMARERSISVILSTHILPDVEAVCDDAIVLRDGNLVAVERVMGRAVQAASKTRTWFDVEVLGRGDEFRAQCKTMKLETRKGREGLQVAAPTVDSVLKAARLAGTVLVRALPGTHGIEDAVLVHLEEGGERP